MAEKIQVTKEKVENSGIFDFKGLYSYVHSWLREENYDTVEEKYTETVSGNSRNIYFEWTSTKKLSDYFKRELKFKFDIKELVEVEVEIDGKKKKMNKGKVSVEIKGNLIRDPESKWESTPYYRFLRDVYNKYVIPARVDNMESLTFSDVVTLKEELKAYLELTGRRK
jgi:hypothetical protein